MNGWKRKKQCKACPWRKDAKLEDIPDYNRSQHHGLEACSKTDCALTRTLRVMACHETTGQGEQACVGWVLNQLGPGNNITLRMRVATGRLDVSEFETFGPQYETFEETLR